MTGIYSVSCTGSAGEGLHLFRNHNFRSENTGEDEGQRGSKTLHAYLIDLDFSPSQTPSVVEPDRFPDRGRESYSVRLIILIARGCGMAGLIYKIPSG